MERLDLREKDVITARDLEGAVRSGLQEIEVHAGAVITSSARDILQGKGIRVVRIKDERPGTTPTPVFKGSRAGGSPEAVFNSPEAMAIREEIVRVGKKLWSRNFVDGNGGNISYRLTDRYVLCTPTLMSKTDMTVDDLCLVDMEGNQVAGKRKRTSEVLLHLEIYKTVEKARSCVHAHPPHATAYAITGTVPPNCIIPEEEIFVGMVAYTPYETPGTHEVANQIIAVAKDHNTILLGNHGVICWADTPTHAEWQMEVLDTYCHTLVIASQLGAPITRISPDKTEELLQIKKKMDLPDARFSGKECTLCDMPDTPGGITVCRDACGGQSRESCQSDGKTCPGTCGTRTAPAGDPEAEAVIQRITDEVMRVLNKN